jgi:putative membrane protein
MLQFFIMNENKITAKSILTHSEEEMDPRTDLAVERTELALERTQLAWIRTLLSMIGGGFVVDKGLAALHKARVESGEAWVNHAHLAGLVITGSGTLLMIIVTILYYRKAVKLARLKHNQKFLIDPAIALSLLTVILGVILLYFIFLSREL